MAANSPLAPTLSGNLIAYEDFYNSSVGNYYIHNLKNNLDGPLVVDKNYKFNANLTDDTFAWSEAGCYHVNENSWSANLYYMNLKTYTPNMPLSCDEADNDGFELVNATDKYIAWVSTRDKSVFLYNINTPQPRLSML